MPTKKLNDLMSPLRRISIPKINASVLLFLSAVLAMILANSAWSESYFAILNHPIEVKILGLEIFQHHGHTMTFAQFVNDALMAIFFLVVGLEIKQEMVVGELSSVKKALLPVIAAMGGMVVPVLFFLAISHEPPASAGAAIPMATDIAFALALLGALGSRVPSSLRIFLMALAVVDDIGGIIVIALFYSSHVDWASLAIAGGVLLGIYLAGRRGMTHPLFYMLGFWVVWFFFVRSGIHATISGVLTALCVPLTTQVHIEKLRSTLRAQFDGLSLTDHKDASGATVLSHDQLHVTTALKRTLGRTISPVQTLEHMLAPIVSYVILPVFAFANAGVDLGGVSTDGLFGLPLAILLGLFPGKAVGITLFTWVAIKLGLCSWPSGMNLKRLIPLSIFGGIGFTVALFIASLSYDASLSELLNQAKLGIFAGTILSAVVGYLYLSAVLPKGNAGSEPAH